VTVAIHKKIRRRNSNNNMTHDAAQPIFSFQADPKLAQVIVDAWLNVSYTYTPPGTTTPVTVNLGDALLQRDRKGNPTKVAFETATAKIKQALTVDLKRAVVISEDEHDKDYKMRDPDTEVVFVLPNYQRLGTAFVPGRSLLDTARILMACTPNGI